jgi:hypothetical protein
MNMRECPLNPARLRDGAAPLNLVYEGESICHLGRNHTLLKRTGRM